MTNSDARDAGRSTIILPLFKYASVSILCLLAVQSRAEYVKSATEDLLRAAERGDAVQIQIELTGGADPNGRDDVDRPAIFLAAASGSTDAVRVLLGSGAVAFNESHLLRSRESTPLAIAAWNRNTPMINLLLDRGADVTVNDYDALRGVIVTDAAPMLRRLLPLGFNQNYRFKDGETTLTVAAIHGSVNVLAVFLEGKGNVNGRNDTGLTPLILASALGRESTVQLLLDHGADTSLMDVEAVGALAATRQIKDPALRARVSSLLVAHGANSDRKNRPIDEQLLLAAYRGDLPAVKALASKGADLSVRGVPNTTLWLRDVLSASVAHPPVCQFLLEHNVSPYMRDSVGFSPLHTAATSGHPDCIRLLLEYGVDPNVQAKSGQTPLSMAINSKRPPAVIAALLKGGADPNGPAPGGNGSLIATARARGLAPAIELLQAAGGHE